MKLIGAHLSISKGIWTLQKQMDNLKSNTCALFLKSSRRWTSKPLSENDKDQFLKKINNPKFLLPHGSYLINLANNSSNKGYECMIDDLKRCFDLGITLYNIHPGADVNNLGEKALELISENINRAHEEVENVIICIENMAGQGTVCGRTFEEIRDIIKNVKNKDRIGVTLDTCHLFGGGYDIREPENFEKIMNQFDEIVGLKYLKAIHLNDSKEGLNSRKDRHECLGEGKIGIEAFRYIMNSKIFEDIPMILETPIPDKYKEEIQLLYSLIKK